MRKRTIRNLLGYLLYKLEVSVRKSSCVSRGTTQEYNYPFVVVYMTCISWMKSKNKISLFRKHKSLLLIIIIISHYHWLSLSLLAIIEWGWVGGKELCRSRRMLAEVNNITRFQLACIQTLYMFYFRSFGKHRRARERGEHARKKNLRLRSVNPPRFIFYHARSTDFEEKIEGLWTD